MYGKLSTDMCFSKVLELFWPASGATKVLGTFEKQAHDENSTLKRVLKTLLKNQYKVIIPSNHNS